MTNSSNTKPSLNNKIKKRGRPAKGGLGFDDTREALIRCGMELLTEQGFNNTGLDQILKKVNVPKGSFYHYFENKEAYGYVVLEHYSQFFIHKLNKHLSNTKLPALDRLKAFIEDAIQGVERFDFKRGCLVGNLTLELGSSHDEFRDKLDAVFNNWQLLIADCLELAKTEDTLAQSADSNQLADYFWISWEGAVMRAKLTQNKQPIELFSQQFFKLLPTSTENTTK